MDLPTILETIQKKGKKKKRSDVKELLMLIILDREGPIGRYRLKDFLGLSEHEGLVRKMLKELQIKGYVSANKSGSILTKIGKKKLAEQLLLLNILNIRNVETSILSKGPLSIGVHLRDCANKIESVMKLRDMAIRGGASEATIVFYQNNQLIIPSVDSDFYSKNPILLKKLSNFYRLKNNDVIILLSSDTLYNGIEASIFMVKSLFSV